MCSLWCGGRDLNPHEQGSLPPQDSVSTSSTTTANKGFCGWDYTHPLLKTLLIILRMGLHKEQLEQLQEYR